MNDKTHDPRAMRAVLRWSTLVPTAALALGALALGALATTASAQAWNYPSFQPPRTVEREYNFGLSDGGDPGTSVTFQWREGLAQGNQLSLDVGFADPNSRLAGNSFFLGGQFAHQIQTARPDLPLDLLFTVGLNAAFADGFNLYRIPVGVSVGHRFPLEQGLAVTPYVHPRASIDFCSRCDLKDNSDIGLDFDLGVNFEISRQIALRASAQLGGSKFLDNDNSFGIALAWSPASLRR